MVGRTVSHYRVVERIGAGGMGVVYRAEDTRLGRPLALKVLPPETCRDPLAIERFEREARTASSLNHPNICTIYDIGEVDGQHFIAMEYLDGQTLDAYIGGRPLPMRTVLELGVQIADALDAAHSQGILHRDIKPANIFVTRRGQAKVLDFGLAKLTQASQAAASTIPAGLRTTGGMAMGTIAYMSPEQARGEELDSRTDLFSFGVVLHEMATGRQAFGGTTTAVVFDAILNRMPPPITPLNPEAPPELERIIEKAIDKDPVLRYQTAADLRADLQRLKRDQESGRVQSSRAMHAAAGSGPLAPAATALPRRLPSLATFGLLAGAVGLGALGVAGYLIWPGRSAPAASTPAVAEAHDASASDETATDHTAMPAPADAASSAGTSAPPPTVAPAGERTAPRPDERPAASRAPARRAAPERTEPSIRVRAAPVDEVAAALETSRDMIARSEFDEAVTALQMAVGRQPDSPSAARASLEVAGLYERQRRTDAALAAYLRVRNVYPSSPEAATALARMATLVLQTRQRDRQELARGYLSEIVEKYPESPEAPAALASRGLIEERERVNVHDGLLARPVPAALVTYRQLAERFPDSPQAEGALWKVARFYDDLKRYDLAVEALERLGTRFPETRLDAWWEAGELLEKRVKDRERARQAYARVPATSRRYRDAQRKLD